MTSDKERTGAPHNVLFLCTGNAGRSIIAEAILNKTGAGRFRAWSAGSHPKGSVHPEALRILARLGHDTSRLRSKSWDEFAGDCPIAFDTIITVCDKVAGEACPVIFGRPAKIHWDILDPASMSGNPAQLEQAFQDVYARLSERVRAFVEKCSIAQHPHLRP